MSLKSLIEKMDQISALSEATKETPTGRMHKAEPGGYGRKDDEDSEGKKVEPEVKRGRGRPKKGADSSTGEVKKYDFAKDLQSFMVGNLPDGKAPGKKGKVHKIKDESIEESTGATDYAPKSQGGSRAELLAKYHKTKNPKDAEAARKAGATQKELKGVTEDTKETAGGRVHKAEPGGYGRKDDEDSEGKKIQAQVKRGRGRPKKGSDSETGKEKKWDTDTLQRWIVGSKPKTLPGKAAVKHKLKDWIEHVEAKMLVESIVDDGQMSEVDMVLQDIINGNSDLYDVMNHPRDPAQEHASKLLKRKYEAVAGECGLHPDDDFEEIQDIMMRELEDEYGAELSEVALDQSQVAAPQIKMPGSPTTPPQSSQSSTQPAQPAQPAGQQPQMGAAVIDFKNPQDPLKIAMQQAVKNKQVSVMASESKQINEGKKIDLEDILQNYPHEHKMAQEGWGIHEALYQALCDHYWNEGRIPREKMYGSGQELRDWVEECYIKDTQPVMGEGLAGAALGGVAGAVVGKTPTAASIGANLGSEMQDTLTTEGDREEAEMQIKTPAFLRKERGAAPLSLSQIGTKDRYGVGGKTYAIGDEPLARGTAAVSGKQVDTLPESELEASLRGSVQDMEEDYMSESKLDEKYMGFKKTVAAIKKGGSAEDPEAVAASIGRKKYGKEKFQKAAAAGKKLGEQGVAEGSAPEIDKDATRDHGAKIYKMLADRFGANKFNLRTNSDGTNTISKLDNVQWAENIHRQYGQDRDPSWLEAHGVLTGKNFNDAVDPWYKGFRERGWRFDQPQGGEFTIAVYKKQGVAEGDEQVYKVLAVDKSNALSKETMLKVKAGSIIEVFDRLAMSDWYPLEINGVEVIDGKRLKKGVTEAEVEESGLQAYLGNKKYGKKGMDALRKAGREGASKEKMAQIRDKHDKLDEVAPEGLGDTRKEAMAGLQRTVDFAKQHGYKILRSPAGKSMKFVNKELDHTVVARVNSEGDTINVNFEDYSSGISGNDDASYFDETFKNAYEQALENHQFSAEKQLDEVAPKGWEGTVKAMKKHGDIDNPWALAHWMKGKGMKSHKKEGAGDAQMEAWSKQLDTLLTEGLTITTSTGNEHTPDSVSVNATDADAHELMQLVQSAGLGKRQSQSMSSPSIDSEIMSVSPVSQDEVMGTLEPEDDGEESFGFLKRMLGARQDHGDHGAEEHGGDYEEEDGDTEEVSEMGNETASSGDSKMSPVPEGEMDEGNKFTGNLAKARAAGKKEADLDGDGDMEKVKEELKGEQKKLDVAEPKGKLTGADFSELRGEKDSVEDDDEEDDDEEDDDEEDDADDDKEEVDESALDQPATMEAEKTCNECGMHESDCGGTHGEEKLDEWANSPNDSDEQFLADLTFMTKTISGGLNGMKQDQTVLPSTRVKTQGETKHADLTMAEMLRKLQNIN